MANKTETEKHVIHEVPRDTKGEIAGRIQMSEEVVATIAGIAARDIKGIHSLGKSRLIAFGSDSVTRGIDAEVGNKEAALDIEVVVEQGCDIREVAKEMRQKIADEVLKTAGRKVVEVNLDVVGIHLPQNEEPKKPSTEPRVR